MAPMRYFFAIKMQPSAKHNMCGQYLLADRFLRNSVNLVKCEILLTFGCQSPSKRDFEKSKIPKFS